MKIKITFLFITLLFASQCLFSQTKEERVQQIFDKIVQQVDDGREKPKLEFVYNEKKPSVNCGGWSLAWICPCDKIIFFEEELFDFLDDNFKADLDTAISYFLGHEIAHYYKHTKNDDIWVSDENIKCYGHGIAYSKAFSEHSGSNALLPIEQEADIVGCFYSYLAGYDTREIHNKLIVDLYERFRINDEISTNDGYFSRDERKKVSDFVIDSMNKLIPIFEAGNYLYLIGSYEDAIKCYEHIAYYFPSKEILNNLGVCYAELALENASANIAKYKFPFSFESRTVMSDIVAKGITENTIKARDYFQKAIARDPQYWTAYINLASVYVIEERMDSANAILDLIKYPATDDRIIADMNIVKGIAEAIKDKNDAKQYFELAKDGNKEYAEWNLDVMGGKGDNTDNEIDLKIDKEIICETGINTEVAFANGQEMPIKGYMVIKHFLSDQCQAFMMYYLDDKDKRINYIISAGENWKGKTAKGIHNGKKSEEVKKIYGKPSYIYQTFENNYYVYYNDFSTKKEVHRKGLIFKINRANEKVVGWSIFENLESKKK
jgi:tetratricopeptide (TPR) repeat protein